MSQGSALAALLSVAGCVCVCVCSQVVRIRIRDAACRGREPQASCQLWTLPWTPLPVSGFILREPSRLQR